MFLGKEIDQNVKNITLFMLQDLILLDIINFKRIIKCKISNVFNFLSLLRLKSDNFYLKILI